MKFLVDHKYINRDSIRSLEYLLATIDTKRLGSIHIKESRSKRALPGVYGNFRWWVSQKNPQAISIIVKGDDVDFPRLGARFPSGKYGGMRRAESIFDNLDDLIICTLMHELYHYLTFNKFMEGDHKNEIAAIEYSYKKMETYKKTGILEV